MNPSLKLTGLTLRVRDLEPQLSFYRDLLGLEVVWHEGDQVQLAPSGREFTLTLAHDPGAPLRPQPSLGLYHLALLLPDRRALAAVFRRLLETRYPHLQGASDHGVSEALYLADREGNGIELYRDRERSEWPGSGGRVEMYSRQLDLENLLAEAPNGAGLHPQTTFGHLHLHVADLDEAERFFTGLGMAVTQRDYPGARFLAADGYHHHLGTNLWARGRTAPSESTGLVEYSLALAGHEPATLTDPNGIPLRVTAL
jgi:catechol 2,3-dioxygenase